jgi:hypothetical protein
MAGSVKTLAGPANTQVNVVPNFLFVRPTWGAAE